jgi:hypothetical protein
MYTTFKRTQNKWRSARSEDIDMMHVAKYGRNEYIILSGKLKRDKHNMHL